VSGEVSEKEVLSVVTRRSQAALEARRKEVQAAIFNQMKQSVKGRKTNRFVAKEELLGLLPQFPSEEMEEAITVLVEGGKLFIDGDNIRLI
jgi:type III secretory pathway component EscR